MQSIFFGDFYSEQIEESAENAGASNPSPIEDDEDQATNLVRNSKESRGRLSSKLSGASSRDESSTKLAELETSVSELTNSNKELKVTNYSEFVNIV